MQKKPNHRYAVIDIGTNSVIMLVCDVDEKERTYNVVLDKAEITRLGQGLYPLRRIRRAAMDRTCAMIRQYLAQARAMNVEKIIAVGTSVLRDATNATEFIRLVKSGFSLDVEVIPSDAEARFSYLSVRTDQDFLITPSDNLIMVDVGGGSTEFVFGQREVNTYLSVNVGAVHLTDRFLKNDPPTDDECRALDAFLEETLTTQVPITTNQTGDLAALVGIGGTIVNLAAIKKGLKDPPMDAVHGETLSSQEIADAVRLFRGGTLDDRLTIPGLEARRADVIIAGAVILQNILKHVGVDHIQVSTRGVRYGVMVDRFVSGIGESK